MTRLVVTTTTLCDCSQKDCGELVDFYYGTCRTWLSKGAKLSLVRQIAVLYLYLVVWCSVVSFACGCVSGVCVCLKICLPDYQSCVRHVCIIVLLSLSLSLCTALRQTSILHDPKMGLDLTHGTNKFAEITLKSQIEIAIYLHVFYL